MYLSQKGWARKSSPTLVAPRSKSLQTGERQYQSGYTTIRTTLGRWGSGGGKKGSDKDSKHERQIPNECEPKQLND